MRIGVLNKDQDRDRIRININKNRDKDQQIRMTDRQLEDEERETKGGQCDRVWDQKSS